MMTLIGTFVTITFELTYENTSCSTYLNRDRPNMFGKTEPNQTECLAEPDVRQKYAPFAEHVRPFWPNIQGVPKQVGINNLVCFVYDLVDSDCVIWS